MNLKNSFTNSNIEIDQSSLDVLFKSMNEKLNSNEANYLPISLRSLLKQTPEAIGLEDEAYIIMFPFYDRIAIRNNFIASQWANGFVPLIHYNMLNSKTCSTIANILTSKIVGNIGIEGEEDIDVKQVKDAIIDFQNKITQMESDVLIRGEACITTNYFRDKEDNLKVSLEVYPLGRYQTLKELNNEIYEAYLFKALFDGEDSWCNYLFVEHRYYKKRNGEKVAYLEYNIVKNTWTTKSSSILKQEVTSNKLEEENVPQKILDKLGDIKINKPIEILDLGVYRFKNTAINKLARYTDIGESQFINATGFMQSLENTLTYQEMDKYIGRGRVMTPQFSNSKNGIIATLQGKSRGFNILDYSFMTPYSAETGSLDSKVPVQPVQFNLRSAEWKLALEEAEAKVCLRCGLSVLDFDPSLATTMRTATEVNYMNDITANTVKSKRALLKYELDRLVSDIAKQLGLEISVFVVFDNSTIVDKVQNQALILQQYQSGLISLDTAVKQLHPEWKQEEVEAELDRINLERGGTRVDDNFNNILGV